MFSLQVGKNLAAVLISTGVKSNSSKYSLSTDQVINGYGLAIKLNQ